jgi:hypothetical protein
MEKTIKKSAFELIGCVRANFKVFKFQWTFNIMHCHIKQVKILTNAVFLVTKIYLKENVQLSSF